MGREAELQQEVERVRRSLVSIQGLQEEKTTSSVSQQEQGLKYITECERLTARKMMGETKPFDSAPGSIRGDFCIEVGRNIIHGSDAVESAKKELALWFKPEELFAWTQGNHSWIYE